MSDKDERVCCPVRCPECNANPWESYYVQSGLDVSTMQRRDVFECQQCGVMFDVIGGVASHPRVVRWDGSPRRA